MTAELTFLSALLVGLLGSTHCIGMCGGIAGVLSVGAEPQDRPGLAAKLPLLLAYNLGRISSYVLAGVLAGLLGGTAAGLLPPELARRLAMLISSIFLLALGLYIGGWWTFLTHLERWGSRVWRRLEPLGRGLLPVRTPVRALALGLLWGWLPCGLVYTALVWSMASASPWTGGLLMLGFGLGTLPMLVALGAAGEMLRQWRAKPIVRHLAGAALLVFGLIGLWGVLDGGHGHHAHASMLAVN